jgi:hypothetical protein
MASQQNIRNFQNAVGIGNDNRVEELADIMPIAVLKAALERCKRLNRDEDRPYQSTLEIVEAALIEKMRQQSR